MHAISSFGSVALGWISSPTDGPQSLARIANYYVQWKSRFSIPLTVGEERVAQTAAHFIVFLEVCDFPKKIESLFKPVRVYTPGALGRDAKDRSYVGELAKKATDWASFLARSSDIVVYGVECGLVSASKEAVKQLKILSLGSFCYMGLHGLWTEGVKSYTIWKTGRVIQSNDVAEMDRPFQVGVDGVQMVLKTIESVALVVFSAVLIAGLVGFAVPCAELSVLVATTALTAFSTLRYFWEKLAIDSQMQSGGEGKEFHGWVLRS